MNGAICVKTFQNITYVFAFSVSHSKKNSARYDHKYTHAVISSTRYSCHILTKSEPSNHIFEKTSNIKLHQNPSTGSRVVPCGREKDMMIRAVDVGNFANAPKTRHITQKRKIRIVAKETR
jgi:hypothetical protein